MSKWHHRHKTFSGKLWYLPYPRKHKFLVREQFFVEISFTNQNIKNGISWNINNSWLQASQNIKGKEITTSYQKQSSWQKGVLKNGAKFTGKHLCQSLFVNKYAGLSFKLWWLLLSYRWLIRLQWLLISYFKLQYYKTYF